MRLVLTLFLGIWMAYSLLGGYVEDAPDGTTVIHIKLHDMPDPSRTDTPAKADTAVLDEFIKKFPSIFAEKYREKYKANPEKYGKHNWDKVVIKLSGFSGITIPELSMDSRTLMAIAGGVAPDVIYVNFRQSDTYIQQNFLYPLDKPEDNYFPSLSKEDIDVLVHPKIWPVIKRKGPDGKVHIWAVPQGGIIGRVVLYRKDLLDSFGIPYPKNDWTWDDFIEICRKVTDPEKGTYGLLMGKGKQESWWWVTFLWSAGGDVLIEDPPGSDNWKAVFNSEAGIKALDFYTRLWIEEWYDRQGKKRRGYVVGANETYKWNVGQVAFYVSYIDEKSMAHVNPDVIGMVPVPFGPGGNRGAELNSRMQGIFNGVKDPVIRDAAWEYLRFCESKEALGIRVRVMVEGGMGRFVNPKYLRMFGYEDIIRLAPKGWEECLQIALDTGKPEPYGKNAQLVYDFMTPPLEKARQLAYDGKWAATEEERAPLLKELLDKAANEANEKMIGIVPGDEMLVRRAVASVVLLCIAIAFSLVLRKITQIFTPPDDTVLKVKKITWGFRKYAWGYLLLIPAVLSILLWNYTPLVLGSKMAFMDYRIMGDSKWIWLDNFANVLWDVEWWKAIRNSLRYSILVISLTFLPPVILAVLLQEVPRGKMLFRVLFYLPAVITGLVVIYLWRSFYDETEYGVLNAVLMHIPAIGFILIGALFFMILFFFTRRLLLHEKRFLALCCFIIGVGLFLFFFNFAKPILTAKGVVWYKALFNTIDEPFRWLSDPKTALVCCVIPSVWAGMGPGCLLYLAALKGISDDFYEAADLDGATFIDKILFVVIPVLKPLLIIQFVGIFISSWSSEANILIMTGGGADTEVAGLHIFYKAYMYLKFGPATAMAWILGFMLIGFTVHQLRILSRLEFKTTGR